MAESAPELVEKRGGTFVGSYRGSRVRVTSTADGGEGMGPYTTYHVYFDDRMVGPPGFRRVGSLWSLGTRLLRQGLVTVGGIHYKARDPAELDVWLTDHRLALLWEMTDRQQIRWTVTRSWRHLTLHRWRENLLRASQRTIHQRAKGGLDEVLDRVDALRWVEHQPLHGVESGSGEADRRIIPREEAFSPDKRRSMRAIVRWVVALAVAWLPAGVVGAIGTAFVDLESDTEVSVLSFGFLIIWALTIFLIVRGLKRSSEQKRWRNLYSSTAEPKRSDP